MVGYKERSNRRSRRVSQNPSISWHDPDDETIGSLLGDYKVAKTKGDGTFQRNRIIETYYDYVKILALKIFNRLPQNFPLDLDDLTSYGVLGLTDAVENFDFDRGSSKFPAYITIKIRGAILEEIRNNDPLSRSSRARSSIYESERKGLASNLRRTVSPEEVYENLAKQIGPKKAEKILAVKRTSQDRPLSLDQDRDSTGDGSLNYLETLVNARAEDPTERLRKLEFLRVVLGNLNQPKKLAIILYYYEEQNLEEIGRQLIPQNYRPGIDPLRGVSGSMAGQICRKAIAQLRNSYVIRRYFERTPIEASETI